MKKVFLLLLMSVFSHVIHAEYAIIDDIVYNLNVENLTAIVLNFQNAGSDVAIPAKVSYRGDQYIVRSISRYDFDYNSIDSYNDTYHTQQMATSVWGDNWISDAIVERTMKKNQKREEEESYFQYDYNYTRAAINTLQLPNTIKYIYSGSFDGMTRLRALIIPASVDKLPDGENTIFNQSMPRLEHVIVMGLPTFSMSESSVVTFTSMDNEGNFNYIEKLKQKIGIHYCPNLKTFQVPEFKAKQSILDTYTKANQLLKKATVQWNNDLSRSPYNNGAKIATPVLKAEVCLDAELIVNAYKQAIQYIKNRGNSFAYQNAIAYTIDSLENELKKHPYYNGVRLNSNIPKLNTIEMDSAYVADTYISFAKQLGNQYRDLAGWQMEQDLKISNPKKYIDTYQQLHPDKKHVIDSIRNEYRCQSQEIQSQIAVSVLDGQSITQEPCRKTQWNQYGDLFDNQEEFERSYNANTNNSFNAQIGVRQNAKSKLTSFKQYASENIKQIKLKSMRKKPNEQTQHIILYLDEFKQTYYYVQAIEYLLSQYPKITAEYEKNKNYFTSQIDFFEAYTSDNYGSILKNNKNK